MIYNIIIFLLIGINSILAEVSEGNMLFSTFSDDGVATTYLINNNLESINTWQHDSKAASMPYLYPDGTLLYPGTVSDIPTMDLTNPGGKITKYNWYGEIIWDYIFADSLYIQHHDIEPLPNGNILILAYEVRTFEEGINAGKLNLNGEIWSEKIVEIKPNGLNGADVVWEWYFWDHLIQDVDPEKENFGVISENPNKLDINAAEVIGPNPNDNTIYNGDWLHCNSIHYNHNLDQIVISSRRLCELLVIDHSTTTQEASSGSGGLSGKGGDFLYRWGNPQNYNRGTEEDKKLFHQHSVNWIEDSYPGEGNLILYNNGTAGSGGPGYSSIIELIPPLDNNNYVISENSPYGPENVIWEYDGGNNNFSFYSGFQSGAFRLSNGNTLITVSLTEEIFEINSEGQIELTYNADGFIARTLKYQDNYLNNNLGDVNSDDIINILDIITIINFILANDMPNTLEFYSSDLDNNNLINVIDIISILNLIL